MSDTQFSREELDQEIGQIDAVFLLGFFVEEIGPGIDNKGLNDALVVMDERMESVRDDILLCHIARPYSQTI